MAVGRGPGAEPGVELGVWTPCSPQTGIKGLPLQRVLKPVLENDPNQSQRLHLEGGLGEGRHGVLGGSGARRGWLQGWGPGRGPLGRGQGQLQLAGLGVWRGVAGRTLWVEPGGSLAQGKGSAEGRGYSRWMCWNADLAPMTARLCV